ncbi:MAG: peptide ABC transporter substrate-binding protein [Clostridia bacterium]|nr:peptide ABC transporter substrate-binding protein [Clostridia bacterium]
MKRFLSLILAAVLIFSLTSCSGGDNKAIAYSLSASPVTLDPQFATDSNAHLIINNTFEGLLRLSADGEIIPGIAESHSISSDRLTYTFNLKKGTEWYCPNSLKSEFGDEFYKRFSKEKVTAKDFVFAMQRAVSPATNSPSAHRLFVIENAVEIHSGKADVSSLGVTAPDDYTLIIKLREPCDDMLERLTESVFMPCNEDFFNTMNGRYGLTHRHILCNGPFYVSAWDKEGSLSIRKNKYYSGSQAVMPSSVNFDFDYSIQTIADKISTATVSAAILPPDCATPENSVVVKENPNSVFGFVFNCTDPKLKNTNLRLALCSSIDRSLFGENSDSTVPMSGFVPKSCTFGAQSYRDAVGVQTPHIETDNTAAAAYWDKALSELEASKVSLTVLCPEWAADSVRRQLQIWQQIMGISLAVTIEVKAPEEIQSAVSSGDFQLALAGIESSHDSTVDFLASFRNGGVFRFDAGEYGMIIDRLLTVEDEKELLSGCYTAENYLLQNAVCYPLYNRSSRFVMHDEIEGITIINSESSVSFIGVKRFD